MDPEINELKDLVQKDLAMSADTNRVVHSMRRAARFGWFLQFIWWVLIIAVSGAAYYYYFEPYVKKAQEIYANVQGSNKQVQGWEQQVAEFFKKFMSQQPPASTTSQVPQGQ